MKVSEVFSGIQGEGKYAGYPALFIRLSGCTRACSFCDTKYHIKGKDYSIDDIVKIIKDSNKKIVVWTGGEPLLQIEEIGKVYDSLAGTGSSIHHHLETNGDLIAKYIFPYMKMFDYVCASPKSLTTAIGISMISFNPNYDIKVVTDLKLNKELIPYATILMPLSVDFDGPIDKQIKQKVWGYCEKHNIRYTPRLHVEIFGKKRGI
jgi:7-carboxy-7-deazaguanine synthase